MASHLIDNVAKALAGNMSRRGALKVITGGISAAVMAHLAFAKDEDEDKDKDKDKKCKPSQVACKGGCCPEGHACIADGCCPPAQVCKNKCCAPGEICNSKGKCVPGSPSPSAHPHD
jgi:hypothetical protein